MRALIAPVALSLLATAAIAQSSFAERDAARLQTLLAGRTAGKPENCVPLLRNLNSTRFIDGSLVYSRSSSARRDQTIWRNQPYGGCAPGRRDVTMVTQRPQNQACRGDIVQVFDQITRIPLGSCVLSDFIPYTKAQ